VILLVRTGERPLKPNGCEAVGFSEKLWDAMQRGWAHDPKARPPLHVFDTLSNGTES
jgi:hypothetical protein